MPHVSGAGGKWLNQRFANAVVSGGQQHEDRYAPADRFPSPTVPCTDPHSGRSDAILKRPETDPLIVHTQTATEYWQRRGSLVHTDCEGNDLAEPEGVRIYHWTGTQHSADPNQREPRRAVCENWLNVAQTSMLFRAMLDALDRWASEGRPPPPSRYPAHGGRHARALTPWRQQFPALPGGAVPQGPTSMPALDFGPRAGRGDILDREPPEVLAEEGYPGAGAGSRCGRQRDCRRARVDDRSARRHLRRLEYPAARRCAAARCTSSRAATSPSRTRRRNARPRATPAPPCWSATAMRRAICRPIEAAARTLIEEGFMLEEDLARVLARAEDWGRPLTDVRLP